MRLKIGVVAAATAALIAAGCGGSAGGNKTASGGASVAPGSAVAYAAVDSNLDSAGWTKAKALLDRFPGKDQIITQLRSSLRENGLDYETDIKPALGDEVNVVWLDFGNNGDNVVGLTKPKDTAKFNALLSKSSTPMVSEEVDGWTAFAQTQALLNRFDQARTDSGALQDESTFSDHFDALPADSIAKAWVQGRLIQGRIDQQLHKSGLAADFTKNQFGTLDALTAAVTPGSDGIKLTSTFAGDLKLGGSDYHAELPKALPSGAIFYLSTSGLGNTLNGVLSSLGSSVPNFDRQRAQIELVLGYPLSEVFDLLNGEDAIAVYKPQGSGTVGVLFVADVSDESKAQSILDRLANLAAAAGNAQVQNVQIGSVQAKEITVSGISAFAAVFDGKLVTTNSRKLLEQMIGSGPKLADDAAYIAAMAGAGMPDQTTGFVYSDLQETLDYAFDYVETQGNSVPQVVKDNTAPLRGLLLYGSKDGGDLTLTGFVGIQ
jgi:hypothetical protein